MEPDMEELSAALALDEDEAREEDMAGADSRGNLAQLRLLRLRQMKRRQLLLRRQQILQGAPRSQCPQSRNLHLQTHTCSLVEFFRLCPFLQPTYKLSYS